MFARSRARCAAQFVSTPMSGELLFEEAQTSDYPQLLAMNDAAVPAVNRIDSAELSHLHQQSLALITARDSNDIAGFLLALPETADYQSVNFLYFQSNYPEFAYVDRIIVNSNYRRLGVGARLYAKLFEIAAGKVRVTCEVNLQPENPASMAFHENLGFEKVGEQDTSGGSKRVALLSRAV